MTPAAAVLDDGDRASLHALAWSRIALGALFLVRTTPVCGWLNLPFATDASPLWGWPGAHWAGEGWLHLPPAATAAACIVRTLSAASFTVGAFSRVSGLIAGVLGYLVMAQHPFGAAFTLHLLFQGALVLAMGDCGAVLAIRPEPPLAPQSSARLVRWFLASIYLWAGIAKLRPDWLDGRTLALFDHDGGFSPWASHTVLATSVSRAVCAFGVAVTELSLPVLLLLPRTRRLGLWTALALHAAIELAARPDLLGWEMVALLLSLWPETSVPVNPRDRIASPSPASQ